MEDCESFESSTLTSVVINKLEVEVQITREAGESLTIDGNPDDPHLQSSLERRLAEIRLEFMNDGLTTANGYGGPWHPFPGCLLWVCHHYCDCCGEQVVDVLAWHEACADPKAHGEDHDEQRVQ